MSDDDFKLPPLNVDVRPMSVRAGKKLDRDMAIQDRAWFEASDRRKRDAEKLKRESEKSVKNIIQNFVMPKEENTQNQEVKKSLLQSLAKFFYKREIKE